jgi:hypothetical protein
MNVLGAGPDSSILPIKDTTSFWTLLRDIRRERLRQSFEQPGCLNLRRARVSPRDPRFASGM